MSLLTFRGDPGVDFATLHLEKAEGPRSCVFPFKFDVDGAGAGALETFNRCTKVCTDQGGFDHLPATPQQLMELLSPDNDATKTPQALAGQQGAITSLATPHVSRLEHKKTGCQERGATDNLPFGCTVGKQHDSEQDCQRAPLWCATSVSEIGRASCRERV